MIKQKTLITITDIKEIVGETITVIKENGSELKLPISRAERLNIPCGQLAGAKCRSRASGMERSGNPAPRGCKGLPFVTFSEIIRDGYF
jgi:hypothetical protein